MEIVDNTCETVQSFKSSIINLFIIWYNTAIKDMKNTRDKKLKKKSQFMVYQDFVINIFDIFYKNIDISSDSRLIFTPNIIQMLYSILLKIEVTYFIKNFDNITQNSDVIPNSLQSTPSTPSTSSSSTFSTSSMTSTSSNSTITSLPAQSSQASATQSATQSSNNNIQFGRYNKLYFKYPLYLLTSTRSYLTHIAAPLKTLANTTSTNVSSGQIVGSRPVVKVKRDAESQPIEPQIPLSYQTHMQLRGNLNNTDHFTPMQLHLEQILKDMHENLEQLLIDMHRKIDTRRNIRSGEDDVDYIYNGFEYNTLINFNLYSRIFINIASVSHSLNNVLLEQSQNFILDWCSGEEKEEDKLITQQIISNFIPHVLFTMFHTSPITVYSMLSSNENVKLNAKDIHGIKVYYNIFESKLSNKSAHKLPDLLAQISKLKICSSTTFEYLIYQFNINLLLSNTSFFTDNDKYIQACTDKFDQKMEKHKFDYKQKYHSKSDQKHFEMLKSLEYHTTLLTIPNKFNIESISFDIVKFYICSLEILMVYIDELLKKNNQHRLFRKYFKTTTNFLFDFLNTLSK